MGPMFDISESSLKIGTWIEGSDRSHRSGSRQGFKLGTMKPCARGRKHSIIQRISGPCIVNVSEFRQRLSQKA